MAVATLTSFPSSFIAGDTVRVTIGDSRFSSTLWTLKVQMQSANITKTFAATAGPSTSFSLVITAADSAEIEAGIYRVSYVYVETSSSERQTDDPKISTQVYSNPETAGSKSVARQTLEAMEAAFLKVARNPRLSVNFAGQSFTNRNLKDFQDAIDRQRALVKAEDGLIVGPGSGGKIFHPL